MTKSARIAAIAAPIALVALALAVRLVNLDQFDTLVFDETYYVKDAYALYQAGHELKWDDNANELFEVGDPSGMGTEASFVVHPPLGKWILGLGTALFGIESVWAWRLPAVLVGVALVAVTYFLGVALTRSVLWGSLAGFFMAIDSQAIVMSRTALLDIVLALFVALGVAFIALDRRGAPARVVRWLRNERGMPVFLYRPWLMAAGVAFGCAAATKWSGLYYLAAFGLWSVVMDVIDSWRASKSPKSLVGFLTQGPVSFVLLCVPAAIAYLASFSGWFFSGGYMRYWAHESQHNRISWLPDEFPPSWHSFIEYHVKTYEFHVGLTKDHAFQSPAIEWLLMLRPTGFASDNPSEGVVQYVSAMPNMILWWAGTVALLAGLFLLGRTLNPTLGMLLLAIAAGYVPWLLYPDRTIFSFYSIVYEPFLILLLVYLLRWLAGGLPGSPLAADYRKANSVAIAVFVGLVIAAYVFWAPVTYGFPIDEGWMRLRYWLPGWR